MSIDEIATGEIWLGQAALGKQLVDELKTSDEYLATRARVADVYQLSFVRKKTVQERLGVGVSAVIDRVLVTWWERLGRSRFWQ
ncbi:putative protease SohB [compost metagenome]